MNFEYYIARRIYHSGEQGGSATPPVVRIATAGIALGLAVMILSVAIVIGFKQQIRDKVIGFGGDIQISHLDNNASYEATPISVSDSLINHLSHFPGISHVETFATLPCILKTESDFSGIVLKGVDKNYDWSFFSRNLIEGELPDFNSEKSSTDCMISRRQAELLGLKIDDSFLTYFVSEEVRARKFHITGIYETGFGDYDRLFVLTDIRQIRRISHWDEDEVSGISLRVADYNKLENITEELYFDMADRLDRSGSNYLVRSIKELNPMIFDWLEVQDINVVVILCLILAVAGFTMISGLLIIILERTQMIGLLKAMGESDRSLRHVFLYIAFFLIRKGMLWGNAIGLTLCIAQYFLHIVHLDPEVYYLDAVPINLSIWSILLLNAGTLLLSMLMMLLPATLISRITPARSIRFE